MASTDCFRFVVRRLVQCVLLFFLLPVSASAAVSVRDLTDEEYSQVLREAVARIPELKNIWSQRSARNGVFIGGGVLRGLLVWLDKQQRPNKSSFLVDPPQPPSIHELVLLEGSDFDIYVPDDVPLSLRLLLTWRWDLMRESFYRRTVSNGGPTLDKVRVSPWEIEDPFEAIKAIRQERLEVRLDEVDYADLRSNQLLGDTPLNLSLRFLSFAVDLENLAKPDEGQMERLRALVAQTADLIPVNDSNLIIKPSHYGRAEWTSYRLKRALDRLFRSLGRDTVALKQLLRANGLESVLERRGYIQALPYRKGLDARIRGWLGGAHAAPSVMTRTCQDLFLNN